MKIPKQPRGSDLGSWEILVWGWLPHFSAWDAVLGLPGHQHKAPTPSGTLVGSGCLPQPSLCPSAQCMAGCRADGWQTCCCQTEDWRLTPPGLCLHTRLHRLGLFFPFTVLPAHPLCLACTLFAVISAPISASPAPSLLSCSHLPLCCLCPTAQWSQQRCPWCQTLASMLSSKQRNADRMAVATLASTAPGGWPMPQQIPVFLLWRKTGFHRRTSRLCVHSPFTVCLLLPFIFAYLWQFQASEETRDGNPSPFPENTSSSCQQGPKHFPDFPFTSFVMGKDAGKSCGPASDNLGLFMGSFSSQESVTISLFRQSS